jgi:hypothetical protein
MRAFRITFDESTSKFVIEIQGFAGLYWKKAKVTEFRGEKDEFRVTKSFDTYQKARDYVKDIGLDQVYEDFTLQKPYGSPAVHWGYASHRRTHQTASHSILEADGRFNSWTVPYATRSTQHDSRHPIKASPFV